MKTKTIRIILEGGLIQSVGNIPKGIVLDVFPELVYAPKQQKSEKGSMKLPFPEPLCEKYRPRRVRDFVGLAEVKRTLEAFVKKPFEHAWFFLGGSGLGKTAIAQALAYEINAQLHEVPSAECNLDRVLRETALCQYGAFNFEKGGGCDWHALIVHEADRMTGSAQDSFLSKMDSTAWPPRTIFIFTANSRLNLEKRFMSRCSVLEFEADSLEGELEDYLAMVYKKEGGKYPIRFCDLAKSVGYNVRDALNKLQVELLIGTNRKGLPTKELKILPEHVHDCEKCHKPWKCTQPKCKLPHVVGACPTCGGSTTVGQERAAKAWKTIRSNIAAELKQKNKRKRH